ncbi:hypothetical protein GWK18_09925 [Kocuria sp. JC486]|uniref:hypothetical protein n=1 Tax=Kocuria sp. JC486 TaxID=1970736 RepID=UPI0014210C82|nr:hypothetical protein [Kocuria sp. JC486]NHU85896.1 hypothetical protein [Kocuria sp. JC486]
MSDTEDTYYFVEEKKHGIEHEDNPQSITRSLKQLYKKSGRLFPNEEAFTNAVLNSEDVQRAIGFAVRVATEKDLEDFGDQIAVFEAVNRYNEADDIARATTKEARRTVVEYFNENVRDEDEFKELMTALGLRHTTLKSWFRDQNTKGPHGDQEPYVASPDVYSDLR